MRIVGGRLKGRKINPPANLDVRPTTDFAKEALFNILAHRFDLERARVLELFAGTGNMTYEFISQGAISVLAIEKDPRKTAFIKKTAAELDLSNLQITKQDVKVFLNQHKVKYPLIFADPPYDLPWLATIPDTIFQNDLLEDDGWLILEHGPRTSFKEHQYLMEHRTYGNVNFSIFEKKPAP